MTRDDVPVVSHIAEIGPNDSVFDSFLLLGPVVITLIAALGRTATTTALTAMYLATLGGYLVYRAVDYRHKNYN